MENIKIIIKSEIFKKSLKFMFFYLIGYYDVDFESYIEEENYIILNKSKNKEFLELIFEGKVKDFKEEYTLETYDVIKILREYHNASGTTINKEEIKELNFGSKLIYGNLEILDDIKGIRKLKHHIREI